MNDNLTTGEYELIKAVRRWMEERAGVPVLPNKKECFLLARQNCKTAGELNLVERYIELID